MNCSGPEFGELAKAVLQTGSSLRFEASGWSMHPVVQDGDVLLITPLPHGALRTGDVVLARLEGDRPVVHRIVQRRRSQGAVWFLLKGDRSNTADGWLPADSLLGRVIRIQRAGRQIALSSRRGRLAGYVLAGISPLNLWRFPLVGAAPRLLARVAPAPFESGPRDLLVPVSLQDIYSKSDSLVHREIADEVILVPIRRHVADSNSLYALDGVGPRIWELVDGHRTVEAIVDVVMEEYAVDQTAARADVVGFLSELESLGAVQRVA